MAPHARPSILLTGGTGQIGSALRRELTGVADIAAPGREELDLRSLAALRDAVERLRPSIVINAAAYTMVDRAESERDDAFVLNERAPAALAEGCRRVGAWMIHFSTDYVFDGTKRTPYIERDDPAPLNAYGESKLAGERAVAAAGGLHIIVRTSWVYAASGTNFVATIRRLARERDELSVVGDQVGAPTSARAVARGVASVVSRLIDDGAGDLTGIYHMTAAGTTSWYDFALRILADDPRAPEHRCRVVRRLTSAEYPSTTRRPAWSVLDNAKVGARFGVRLPSWEAQWTEVLGELT